MTRITRIVITLTMKAPTTTTTRWGAVIESTARPGRPDNLYRDAGGRWWIDGAAMYRCPRIVAAGLDAIIASARGDADGV